MCVLLGSKLSTASLLGFIFHIRHSQDHENSKSLISASDPVVLELLIVRRYF